MSLQQNIPLSMAALATAGAAKASDLAQVLNADFKPISRNFFGLHFQRAQAAPGGETLTPYHDVGQTAVRLWDAYQFFWRRTEVAPGVYIWTKLDELIGKAITQAARYGQDPEIIINISQPPAFYTGGTAADGAYENSYNAKPPSDMTVVATWVTALLTRIRTTYPNLPWSSIVLEPSNEPNLGLCWNGTPEQLVAFYAQAHAAAKAISPQIRIVGPSSVGSDVAMAGAQDGRIGGPAYLDLFLNAGGGQYIDLLGIHLYAEYACEPESLIGQVAAQRAVMTKHGLDLPIWTTELGITDYKSSDFGAIYGPKNVGPGMLVRQGNAWIWRVMLAALIGGCARCYYYGVDWETENISVPLVNIASPSTLLPAGRAFKRLADLLADAVYQGYSSSGSTWTVSFVLKTGEKISIAWTTDFAGGVQYDVLKAGSGLILTDDDSGAYATPVAAPVSGKGSLGLSPLILYGQDNSRANPGAGTDRGRWVSVVQNPEFRQNMQSGTPPDDWTCTFANVVNYAGSALEKPRSKTFTATARYQRLSGRITNLKAGVYKIILSGEGAFPADEFAMGIYDGTTGSTLSIAPGSFMALPGRAGRFYFEREFTLASDLPVLLQLALQNQLDPIRALPFSAISVDRFDLVRWVSDEPISEQRAGATFETFRRPDQTGSNYNVNQVVKLIDAATGILVDGAHELLCVRSGTSGTLSGITANTTANNKLISNVGVTLQLGNWIYLNNDGVPRQVTNPLTSNSAEVAPPPTTSLAAVSVQYVEPLFIPLSPIGRLLTCKAPGPALASSAVKTSLMPAVADLVGLSKIPANFFKPGRGIRVTFEGNIGKTKVAPVGDLTITVKIGAAEIATNPVMAPAAGLVNRAFRGEIALLCRSTGATGAFTASGGVSYPATGTMSSMADMHQSGGPVTLDTTVDALIDVLGQWATGHADNSMTLTSIIVEAL